MFSDLEDFFDSSPDAGRKRDVVPETGKLIRIIKKSTSRIGDIEDVLKSLIEAVTGLTETINEAKLKKEDSGEGFVDSWASEANNAYKSYPHQFIPIEDERISQIIKQCHDKKKLLRIDRLISTFAKLTSLMEEENEDGETTLKPLFPPLLYWTLIGAWSSSMACLKNMAEPRIASCPSVIRATNRFRTMMLAKNESFNETKERTMAHCINFLRRFKSVPSLKNLLTSGFSGIVGLDSELVVFWYIGYLSKKD